MDSPERGADLPESWALVTAAGLPACALDRRLRYRQVTATWAESQIRDPFAPRSQTSTFEGRAFLDDVVPGRRERWASALEAILGGRLGQYLDDETVPLPTGARRVVTAASPLLGRNGRADGVLCVRFDLTDAAQTAANDRELLDLLVAARQLQHFLGNQLALTLGYVELLTLDPRLPRELRERVDEALRGVVEATETLTKLRLLTRRELAPDDPSLSDLH